MRGRIDAITASLRSFNLVPDEALIDLFRLKGTPDSRSLARAISGCGPTWGAADTLATQVLSAVARSDARVRLNLVPADNTASAPEAEISVWDIAEFAPFQHVVPDKYELPLLLLEEDIKNDLSDLVRPVFTQGDYGGETHDLLAKASVGGAEKSCAFLLKGRSVKKVMEVGDCGTNGDQVDRLFTAPAELFVVQHVNQIGETVRTSARNHVERIRSRGLAARCCFMDGHDLCRILAGLKSRDSV